MSFTLGQAILTLLGACAALIAASAVINVLVRCGKAFLRGVRNGVHPSRGTAYHERGLHPKHPTEVAINPPPPFDPDPELIDHLEGNQRECDRYQKYAKSQRVVNIPYRHPGAEFRSVAPYN